MPQKRDREEIERLKQQVPFQVSFLFCTKYVILPSVQSSLFKQFVFSPHRSLKLVRFYLIEE